MALVEFEVADAARSSAIARTSEAAGRARLMPGNLRFDVLIDPFVDSRVCIQHEWDREAALSAYLSSEEFAELGSILRPLMLSKPSSRTLRMAQLEAAV